MVIESFVVEISYFGDVGHFEVKIVGFVEDIEKRFENYLKYFLLESIKRFASKILTVL